MNLFVNIGRQLAEHDFLDELVEIELPGPIEALYRTLVEIAAEQVEEANSRQHAEGGQLPR